MSVPTPAREPRAASRAPSPPLLPPLHQRDSGGYHTTPVPPAAARCAPRSLRVPGVDREAEHVADRLRHHQALRHGGAHQRDGALRTQLLQQEPVALGANRTTDSGAAGRECPALAHVVLDAQRDAVQLAGAGRRWSERRSCERARGAMSRTRTRAVGRHPAADLPHEPGPGPPRESARCNSSGAGAQACRRRASARWVTAASTPRDTTHRAATNTTRTRCSEVIVRSRSMLARTGRGASSST